MNIKYLNKRFNEVYSAYIGNGSAILKLFFWLDWITAYIIHGASVWDYFAYGFYKMRYNGRKQYITYKRHKKIQTICNSDTDIEIYRNKIEFNNFFSNFIGRDWLDVNNASEQQFYLFFKRHPFVFVKDVNGFCGKGISKYESAKCDILTLYKQLESNKQAHFIIEEQITQIKELSDFHPWSINTIRIVTLFDNRTDTVHIMAARLRIGNLQNSIDNFHAKGLCANIDIDTGIVCSMGYDKSCNQYILHPVTQKQIIGFKIPFWNECKQFVYKIARLTPTVRYVGWDIVIQENGNFILIEGNDNADHDIQQICTSGIWGRYKSILKLIV